MHPYSRNNSNFPTLTISYTGDKNDDTFNFSQGVIEEDAYEEEDTHEFAPPIFKTHVDKETLSDIENQTEKKSTHDPDYYHVPDYSYGCIFNSTIDVNEIEITNCKIARSAFYGQIYEEVFNVQKEKKNLKETKEVKKVNIQKEERNLKKIKEVTNDIYHDTNKFGELASKPAIISDIQLENFKITSNRFISMCVIKNCMIDTVETDCEIYMTYSKAEKVKSTTDKIIACFCELGNVEARSRANIQKSIIRKNLIIHVDSSTDECILKLKGTKLLGALIIKASAKSERRKSERRANSLGNKVNKKSVVIIEDNKSIKKSDNKSIRNSGNKSIKKSDHKSRKNSLKTSLGDGFSTIRRFTHHVKVKIEGEKIDKIKFKGIKGIVEYVDNGNLPHSPLVEIKDKKKMSSTIIKESSTTIIKEGCSTAITVIKESCSTVIKENSKIIKESSKFIKESSIVIGEDSTALKEASTGIKEGLTALTEDTTIITDGSTVITEGSTVALESSTEKNKA